MEQITEFVDELVIEMDIDSMICKVSDCDDAY